MITALLIIIAILLIALWISTMALWWRAQHEIAPKTIKRGDVIHAWNKAARLARRSWYGSLRYSKIATLWGNKKARKAFVAVFPKSKTAFVQPDMLTGLEHGPSSYFLASLTPTSAKATARRRKPVKKAAIKKVTPAEDLSV